MRDIIEERVDALPADTWAEMVVGSNLVRDLRAAILPFCRRLFEADRCLINDVQPVPEDVQRLFDALSPEPGRARENELVRMRGIAEGLSEGLFALTRDVRADKIFDVPMYSFSPASLKPDADGLLKWVTDNKALLIQTPEEQAQYARLKYLMLKAEQGGSFADVPVESIARSAAR